MKHTLKSIRAVRNLTQAELAKLLDVSLPTLIKWEQCGNSINLKQQKIISAKLKVNIEDIDWKIS